MRPSDQLAQASGRLRGIAANTDSAIAGALADLLENLAADKPDEMMVMLDALTIAKLVNAGEWP